MDYIAKQKKASQKIAQYGATIKRIVDNGTVYVDSITGDVVTDPIDNYNGDLVNPITLNLVTITENTNEEIFKGVETTNDVVYGDFSSDAQYLGALIAEGSRIFMIDGFVSISMGDVLIIEDMDFKVIEIMPFKPGDVEIYKLVGVKK